MMDSVAFLFEPEIIVYAMACKTTFTGLILMLYICRQRQINFDSEINGGTTYLL